MARMLKGPLTLCLALGLISIALGQEQQRPQPKDSSALGPFLSSPDVQKELKLSDEQIGKLKDAISKVIDKYKGDMANFQRMSPEEQQKKMQAFSEENNKAIAGVLDAKQWKRFKQLQWQASADWAILDPDLQKELKMSDEQKKKVDGIFKDTQKKQQEMQKSRETSPEKYVALWQDAGKKANVVLTEDQQKTLKELKGAPFQAFSAPKGGR
jgi:hypothetical protein